MADVTLGILDGITVALREEFGATHVHDHGDDVQEAELPAAVVATGAGADTPTTDVLGSSGLRRLVVSVTVVDRTPTAVVAARNRAIGAIRAMEYPPGVPPHGFSLGTRSIGRGTGATALHAETLDIRVEYSDAALELYD